MNHRHFGREKRDSSRSYTTGFRENVVVAEASYQMIEVLSFREQCGVSMFENTRQELKLNSCLLKGSKTKA